MHVYDIQALYQHPSSEWLASRPGMVEQLKAPSSSSSNNNQATSDFEWISPDTYFSSKQRTREAWRATTEY